MQHPEPHAAFAFLKRTPDAIAGLTKVYDVLHGFESALDAEHHRGTKAGGRFDGLPCEQC